MTIMGRADTCKLTDAMHFVLWACQLKATCGMWLQAKYHIVQALIVSEVMSTIFD